MTTVRAAITQTTWTGDKASMLDKHEQFARDASAELGSLRRANQGVFQILARDQAPGIQEPQQPVKTVRVVSTVQYYLN